MKIYTDMMQYNVVLYKPVTLHKYAHLALIWVPP